MANFLGAAFGFGARDVGLKAATNSATKNLDNINGLLEDQSNIAKKSSIKDLFQQMTQFNVASIADGIRGLTGETGNLSNGLESMGVQAATAAKPILAQMNLTGKEYRKMMGRVTGMSIGLNVGAEAVAETLKSIHTAGKDAKSAIDAMSMSEKEWVKVTQTTGVTMEDFQAVLGNMVASWGASPEQAGKMLDNIMAIGKAANVGSLGIKNVKAQMDALDTVFEKLPPSAARTADEIQDLMESTVRLSGAFKDMGESGEKSVELAQSTANMFAEQSVAIKRAQLGLGSYEDSPLYKWMTMLGVSSEEAISIIDEGSRDVVSGAKRIQDAMAVGIAKGTVQADAAMAGLNEALGSSAGGLGYLVQNLDAGSAALSKMQGLTVDGAGALAKYGNQAHSSGRTLQEGLDLMKEGFETKLRSIARKDVRGFVRDLGKAYRTASKDLKAMASDEAWGPLVKRLSAVNQLGFKGLVMSLDGSNKEMAKFTVMTELAGGALGSMATSMGPVITLMTHGGMLFGMLGKLGGGLIGKLGIIGIAVGALVVGFNMLSKAGVGITELFAKIGKIAVKGVRWFTDILKGIDWKEVGKKLGGFVWDVLMFIPRTIKEWATGDDTGAESVGGELIGAIVEGLWEAVNGIGTALVEIGKTIIEGIGQAWEGFSWDDFKEGVVQGAERIGEWWEEATTSSDFLKMKLDVTSWFKDLGYEIEDGFYRLQTELGPAMHRAGQDLEENGGEMSASMAAGLQAGADKINEVQDDIIRASERHLEKQQYELTHFDRAKMDTTLAEEALYWGSAVGSLFGGAGKVAAGGIEGGMFGSVQSLSDGINRMVTTAETVMNNAIEAFILKIHNWGRSIASNIILMWMAATDPKKYEALMAKRDRRIANDRSVSLKNRLDDFVKREKDMVQAMANKTKENATWFSNEVGKFGLGIMTTEEEGYKGKKKVRVERRVKKEEKIRDIKIPKLAESVRGAAQEQAMAQVAMDKARAEADVIASKGGIVPAQIQNQISSMKIDLEAKTAAMKEVMSGARQQAKKWGMNKEEVVRLHGLLGAVQEKAVQDVKDEATLAAMSAKTQKVAEELKAFADKNKALLYEQNYDMSEAAWEGALGVARSETEGLVEGQKPVGEAALALANKISGPLIPESPIKEGPLAGTKPRDAGYSIMEQFSLGITDSSEIVAKAVSDVLNASVIDTFTAYQEKMEEMSKKKSLLRSIAKQMVRDFGGKLDLGTVKMESGDLSAKQTFEAALEIPGLAGVIAAIASDGHKTRVVLKKISEDTNTIATSDLVTKSRVGGKGGLEVTLA